MTGHVVEFICCWEIKCCMEIRYVTFVASVVDDADTHLYNVALACSLFGDCNDLYQC